jgi:hypothetical protein
MTGWRRLSFGLLLLMRCVDRWLVAVDARIDVLVEVSVL